MEIKLIILLCFIAHLFINIDYHFFRKSDPKIKFPTNLNNFCWILFVVIFLFFGLGELFSDSSSGGFNDSFGEMWFLMILILLSLPMYCISSLICFFKYINNNRSSLFKWKY